MKLYIVHITYFLLLMVCDGYWKLKSVRLEDGGSIVVTVYFVFSRLGFAEYME